MPHPTMMKSYPSIVFARFRAFAAPMAGRQWSAPLIALAAGRDQAFAKRRRFGLSNFRSDDEPEGRKVPPMTKTAVAFSVMPDAPLEKLVEWAREAEDSGFAGVYMTEANTDSLACSLA